MLSKSRGFAFTTVATLALGIGATAAMFSLVNAWLLRPLPLKNPQELVSVWRTRAQAPRQPAYFDLYHDYVVWSSQNRTLQSLGATFERQYALTGAGTPEEIHGAIATPNFFETVGAMAERGRLFEGEDVHADPRCVISHKLWTERFGAASDTVGRTIELNRKPYRILGVLPASFSFRVLDRPFETAVWTVISEGDQDYNDKSHSPVAVIGRLKSGVTPAQAEADLSALQVQLNRRFTDEPEGSGVLAVNLQEDNTRNVRSSLLLLFGAVGVLLLIACVNAGSLILGRNGRRAKEFAVRVALGCGAGRLLQQLTAEVFVIFGFGGALGLLIAFGSLRLFAAWSPFGVLPPGGLNPDGMVLAATATVVLLVALLFGSLPAWRALRMRDADLLRVAGSSAAALPHQLRWRTLFVALEIALSVVLLVGAGLLISTFFKITSAPTGFDERNVLVSDVALPRAVYRTNADETRFCERLLAGLSDLSGVRAAGVAASWPFNVNGLTPVEMSTKQGLGVGDLPQAAVFEVSPGYFEAMGIPQLHGRVFDLHDRADSAFVAVINGEMASEYFGSTDPLGRQIRFRSTNPNQPAEPWLTIVGVVGDTLSVRYNHLEWDRYPAVYTSFFQRRDNGPRNAEGSQTIYLYVQGIAAATPGLLTSVVHSIDSQLPLGPMKTTGDIVAELRSQPRVRATLLGGFGLLTLLLAAAGVGGVMAQMVQQQRRDFGIRMALGALASDVRKLVLGSALKVIFLGISVGVVAAVAAARALSSFLYAVSVPDPATFGAVILVLAVVALLAALFPAQRASRVDPIETLRGE